ncbi:hypothetical protein ppKF707_0467 [Metapseudomonas furukawaii]|uniref:Uncharacterized protein n=1 Tax=Metapseudomonas furukawaii TaxID=1149133 RepID=A0AAD1FDT9_METFU|nr:hypothetical protein ppKF707_0467 [Pseudomonas furukawaii]BAU72297.1 hypothetical protein KF707C_6090 [Pseudomonas furukawaii]
MRSHATGFTGRSPGWQVVILRGLPERCSVARVRGLAAYSCGGSHGATVFPQGIAREIPSSRPPASTSGRRRQPMKGAIMPALSDMRKRLPVGRASG